MKSSSLTAGVVLALLLAGASARAQPCEKPNMMIVLDRSGSMGATCSPPNTKWADAVSAIQFVLNNYGTILRFGLDLFPSNGWCAAGVVNVDVGDGTASAITSALAANPPLDDCYGKTPMAATLMALNQYRPLKDVNRRNFVMLVADGMETCSADPANDPVEAADDLSDSGIRTFVIGFGSGVDAGVLNAIAQAGETGQYHAASDQAGLQQAMDQIINEALVEICDDRDNNCDGLIDEPWPDKGTLCTATQGLCTAQGVWVCNATGDGLACNAQINPTNEVCDGLDNDCDGIIDNGFADADGDGHTTCTDCCDAGNEPMTGCTAATAPGIYPGATEFCNGYDDDCDGAVDESFPELSQPCGACPGSGEPWTCYSDVGECQPGTWYCLDGSLSCLGEVKPAQEVCDALDHDCDGDPRNGFPSTEIVCDDGIDNDCDQLTDAWDPDCGAACQPGQQRPCGTSEGDCEMGVEVCDEDGNWGPCEGGFGPVDEVCDGRDNDCDGLTDENAEPEICDDGIDNDCNGLVDGMDPACGECEPGEIRPCGADVGECRLGQQTCTAEGHWTECAGEIGPVPEECDGLDNDCDGIVDEGNLCVGYDTCLCGECVSFCSAGECPAGSLVCVNNWCVSDPCCGVSCPAGQECDEHGACVDRCETESIQCSEEEDCRMGICVPADCLTPGHECPAGQLCEEAACVDDPCDGVDCAQGSYCREGICLEVACADCTSVQICEGGTCVESLCAGLHCEPGQVCVAGECAADPCQGVYCPVGTLCDGGVCQGDPCAGLACPDESRCEDGYCVAVEEEVDGGTPEDAGRLDGSADAGVDAGMDGGADPGPGADSGPGADPGGSGETGCGCATGSDSHRIWLVVLPMWVWRRRLL